MRQQRWRQNRYKRSWVWALLALLTALVCSVGIPQRSLATLSVGGATAIATAPSAPAPSVPAMVLAQTDPVQAGKDFYDAGQYAQAATALEQAVAQLRSPVQPLPLAAALANLALTYQQLGQWEQATTAIDESLQWLDAQPQSREISQIKAQTLEIAGRLRFAQGDSDTALSLWQQAEEWYGRAQDSDGVINAQLNQAQALRSLGFYRRALDQLRAISTQLHDRPATRQKALALRALGETLQLVGDLDEAQTVLNQSLAIAETLQLPADQASTLLSLGNTSRAQKAANTAQRNVEAAIAYYQQAATLNVNPLTTIQAQLNELSLLIEQQAEPEIQRLLPQIAPALAQLPASRSSVYAHINFAQALLDLGRMPATNVAAAPPASAPKPTASPRLKLLQDSLQTAILQARSLQDKRAESYALGILGEAYETAQQYTDAETVTRQALVLAQSKSTWDIAYRWQWQLGRLLQRGDDLNAAIAAYDAAVENLRSLRGDLAAVNQDVQFKFREEVEPVYRQSVELLLQAQEKIQGQDESAQKEKSALLNKARERIEALQLAELDNFFREACLEGQRVILDQVVDQENPTTAVVYPIVLRDREQGTVAIKTIAKIPGQPLQSYSVTLPATQFEQTLENLQTLLADAPSGFVIGQLQDTANVIYSWLITPLEADLQARALPKTKASPTAATTEAPAIDTLVFILDDALRNIPLAMLWDGEKYLIEKYAIGLSLGLQLFDPTPIARTNLRVLAAGLSEPPKNSPEPFDPLPLVKEEIDSLAKLGLTLTPLVESQFTRQALETQLNANPYNVVHLATHGKFGSRAEDTYILAADGVINVTEFDTLLRSRDVTRPEAIELLVLSACQTATNDKRATLGLAGFAVRAGARSTLASLRNASDQSTPVLMEEFYRQLSNAKEPVTKAEALRRAQLGLLQGENKDFQNPQYWAPYVLVGNWL